jgi:hypothetical protein
LIALLANVTKVPPTLNRRNLAQSTGYPRFAKRYPIIEDKITKLDSLNFASSP